MSRRAVLVAGVAAAVVGLGLAFAARSASYALSLATLALLHVGLASAWNLLGGLTGQISFGHSAFFGLGAYTTALLWLAGLHPLAALPFAGLVAAAYGALWGWPCLRLRGPYFAIATIGVGEATRIVLNNLEATGGSSGLALPAQPVAGPLVHYFAAAGLAAASVLATRATMRSRFGLGLVATRDDPDAAASAGVPVARYQLYALVVSSFLVGVAGGIYARFIAYIVPEKVFGFEMSIGMILMSVIGGLGTVVGPALGALLYVLLEQALLVRFAELHLGAFGLLLMLVVLFEPDGLVGLVARGRRRWRKGRR